MDNKTLIKANNLRNRILEYENALSCFEYKSGDNDEFIMDRTPQIILNIDDLDDGRVDVPLPMILSEALIVLLKSEIEKNLLEAKKQFEAI